MKIGRALFICLLGVLLFSYGCGDSPKKSLNKANGHKTIYVVNYPLDYFATQLTHGIPRFSVKFPVPKDWDPAFWRPKAANIKDYQKADLILINGADFAKWLRTSTLPQSKVVNTSAVFAKNYIINPHAITHSHGPYGKHTHGVIAFTTWMDMSQAITQATVAYKAILNKLKCSPAETKTLKSNYDALVKSLTDIDQQFAKIGKKLNNRPIMASHPVYKYFARRYKLNLKSVHWEAGELQPESEWQKLSNILASHPAKLMIWEEPPIASIAIRLKSLNLKPVVIRHCGNKPPTGDFLSEMKANIARFSKAVDELK